MSIASYQVWELPKAFGCSVFVPAATLAYLQERGMSVEGLIDNAAGNGRSKWEGLGAEPVMFRGAGDHRDRFDSMGWRVEALVGRPFMPNTSGKGENRVDHVSGFEPVWLMAFPPARES
jgi:hypothetical protein